MRLYDELAGWFHLLTHPDEYADEARLYGDLLVARARRPVKRVLELGSGGGNNAFHLKSRFELTLTDLSAPMLELSRTINPECEHLEGDMRTLRLGRVFDAVFIHDAVSYLTEAEDLDRTFATAFVHLAPGGIVLAAPDSVTETFHPTTEHGGRDEGGRGLRYLEWDHPPAPGETVHCTDFAVLLQEASGEVRCVTDRHVFGLFPRERWLGALRDAGFEAELRRGPAWEGAPGGSDVFVGVRPGR